MCALSEGHSIKCDRCFGFLCSLPLWHLRTLHQRYRMHFMLVMQSNGQHYSECPLSNSKSSKSDQHNSRWQYSINSNTCFWLGLCWSSSWFYAHFCLDSRAFPSPNTSLCLRDVSAILRTPFSFLRVVPSSWNVIEIPSFYRGLVGLWVVAGLILITAYQSELFATESITTDSSVQPGSQFTSGDPPSSATGNISFTIVLFQTPITCDFSQFKLEVVASGTTSTGSLSGLPGCIEDSSLPSVNLTYTFPSPLSFTSASSVSLKVTSRTESPLFSHGVWYKILLENYDGTFTQIVETLTNDPNNQLTGDVSVSISNVLTEVLDENDETLKTGYLFSYFSSSAPSPAICAFFYNPYSFFCSCSARILLSGEGGAEYFWAAVRRWTRLAGWRCDGSWISAGECWLVPLPALEDEQSTHKDRHSDDLPLMYYHSQTKNEIRFLACVLENNCIWEFLFPQSVSGLMFQFGFQEVVVS